MLLYSMSVSLDGYIADRDGKFDWGAPSDELFHFHLERVRGIGGHLCGRKLYDTMLVWENDLSFRNDDDSTEFAEVWTALPKIVFSRSPHPVQGNARLAEGPVAEELAQMQAQSDADIEIGGATLAAEAIELDLVDEFHIFRHPIIVGGGIPHLPPVQGDRQLTLVEVRSFDDRVLYEHYRRDRG